MLGPVEIIVVCALGVLGIGYYLFKNYRNDDPQKRRDSDQKNFSAQELRTIASAQKLLKEGNAIGAAQLLETVGLVRDAINCLENGGHIDEAANMLMRMQLPNRAGVVFARHGRWQNAAKCFRLANMPLEVARCEREAGNLKAAAEFFLIANHPSEAAECYMEEGDHRNSAKYFVEAANEPKAIEQFQRLVESSSELSDVHLEQNELEIVLRYVSRHPDLALADILAQHNRLAEAVVNLIANGQLTDAAQVYLRSTSDISEALLTRTGENKKKLQNLAEMFVAVSNFLYAGMAYEKIEDYQKALRMYEKAESPEGINRCYKHLRPELENPASQVLSMPQAAGTEGSFESEPTQFVNVGELQQAAPAPTIAVASSPEDKDLTTQARLNLVFKNSWILDGMTDNEKIQLWEQGRIKAYPAGTTLITSETQADGLYFILEGAVLLSSGEELEAGSTLGEDWILAQLNVRQTCISQDNVKVLFIPAQALIEYLDRNGTIARKLYTAYTHKSRSKTATMRNNTRNTKVS